MFKNTVLAIYIIYIYIYIPPALILKNSALQPHRVFVLRISTTINGDHCSAVIMTSHVATQLFIIANPQQLHTSITLHPRVINRTDIPFLITNLLTPCSRVLDKLTFPQLVKKFPPFYGTPKFITAFIRARHLSLF